MVQHTSRQAHFSLEAHLTTKRRQILSIIKEADVGLALFEIVKKTGISINTVSGQVRHLTKTGFLKDSGLVRLNPETDRYCIIWAAALD